MNCPSCGAGLRPGAKFCDQCGTRAVLACSSCGAELRGGAKFCDECGANQTVFVRAIVPTVERKITSVLFGDLVAFTTLSEQRDKEDVRELLSAYFARCRRIVARYGGTIEKFIGDAVMAVWGAPVVHEDDAERAVRAGLELVRAIETLGEEQGLSGLMMRVGIVTGEVAVTVGADQEGMVAGDAVNTAARVQSVANAGEVWVDGNTRLLTSGAITYSDVGSHALKGKADPVPLWAVRAVVAAIGGAQRADGLEAPLTGRTRELRVMTELFHAVEESGRPALVLVDGDPGLGKSRLGWEFEKYVDGLSRPVTWHATRCLAYGDGVAFWPIAEAVRGRLGAAETGTDWDPETTLDAWLTAWAADASEASWLRPRVLALLGRGTQAGFARDDLFTAWRTFIDRAGGGDPVTLVIDDAQHADEGTVAFVEHLLATSEAPLVLLMLARPGLLQRWPGLATNRRATVLHLSTLEDREMAQLLDGVVSGLPESVRDGLVERAQGVPLYAMETVRSLIDRNLVVPKGGLYVVPEPDAVDLTSIGAPASLQALVAARLDGLPPSERRVIADASVLGATFTREAIGVLTGDFADPDELDSVLAALVRAEMFRTVSSRLSAEYGQYRFVQDIVRQVAYSTQSRRDRKARHLAVAAYFQSLPNQASDLDPVLAEHYLAAIDACAKTDPDLAELAVLACDHLASAATRARALGAPRDALRHLDVALNLSKDAAVVAGLHLQAAWSAYDAGVAAQAQTHAQRAEELFASLGDEISAGEATAVHAEAVGALDGDNAGALTIAQPYWDQLRDVRGAEGTLLHLAHAIGQAQVNLGDLGTEVALDRVRIAESIGDRASLADALIDVGNLFFDSAPTFAAVHLRAGVDLARAEQRPLTALRGLNNLAVLTIVNDLRQGRQLMDEAAEVARRAAPNARLLAHTALTRMLLDMASGAWDEAEELVASIEAVANGRTVLPWADAVLGMTRGAPRRFPTVPEGARNVDDGVQLAFVAGIDMLDSLARGDAVTAARKAVESAMSIVKTQGLADDAIHVWPAAVETTIAAGDTAAAKTLLTLIDDGPPGLVPLGFRAHRHRFAGLLAIRDNAHDEVEHRLRLAIVGFEEWGSPVWAARTRVELANWLEKSGAVEEAAGLRRQGSLVLHDARANGWLAQLGLLDTPVAADASRSTA